MEEKTSAYYQRLHRQRLREQGLVKKEVWILPEHGAALHRLEKLMRLPKAPAGSLTLHDKEEDMETGSHSYWNVRSLAAELKASSWAKDGKLQVEVLANLDKVQPAGAVVIVSYPRIEGATGLPARVWAITE